MGQRYDALGMRLDRHQKNMVKDWVSEQAAADGNAFAYDHGRAVEGKKRDMFNVRSALTNSAHASASIGSNGSAAFFARASSGGNDADAKAGMNGRGGGFAQARAMNNAMPFDQNRDFHEQMRHALRVDEMGPRRGDRFEARRFGNRGMDRGMDRDRGFGRWGRDNSHFAFARGRPHGRGGFLGRMLGGLVGGLFGRRAAEGKECECPKEADKDDGAKEAGKDEGAKEAGGAKKDDGAKEAGGKDDAAKDDGAKAEEKPKAEPSFLDKIASFLTGAMGAVEKIGKIIEAGKALFAKIGEVLGGLFGGGKKDAPAKAEAAGAAQAAAAPDQAAAAKDAGDAAKEPAKEPSFLDGIADMLKKAAGFITQLAPIIEGAKALFAKVKDLFGGLFGGGKGDDKAKAVAAPEAAAAVAAPPPAQAIANPLIQQPQAQVQAPAVTNPLSAPNVIANTAMPQATPVATGAAAQAQATPPPTGNAPGAPQQAAAAPEAAPQPPNFIEKIGGMIKKAMEFISNLSPIIEGIKSLFSGFKELFSGISAIFSK